MCHFITALLPAASDMTAVPTIFDKHKVGFRQIHNSSISVQVAPGEVYVLTTRGWCDCGTPLGSQARHGTGESADHETQLSKFRKQGWSEAKIKRWLEQKLNAGEKQGRKQQDHAANAAAQAERWFGFLSDLLQSGYTARIGLLLHWYRGSVENERLTLSRQEFVPLEHLSIDQLLQMSEDVVYQYIP